MNPLRLVPVVLLSATVMFTGCAKKAEVDQLKANLGDTQYMGIRPKLKVQVLNLQYVKDGKYSSPQLTFTGVIQQQASFPVQKYNVYLELSVKTPAEKASKMSINTVVDGGNAAFSAEMQLSSTGREGAPESLDLSQVEIKVENFTWFPYRESPEGVTLEVGKKN